MSVIKRSMRGALQALPDVPRIAVKRAARMVVERRRLRNSGLLVFAHPKSGGTWLRFQIARLLQQHFAVDEGLIPKLASIHAAKPGVPNVHMVGFEFAKSFIHRRDAAQMLAGKKSVFLLRNPLDVAVSMYMHITRHATHERKLFNRWPLDLASREIFEFVCSDPWGLPSITGFYNRIMDLRDAVPDTKVVTYEMMRAAPIPTLSAIAGFWELGIPLKTIEEAVEFSSFENMRAAERTNRFQTKRLKPGNPSDGESFKTRRAKVNGYRDYFDGSQLEALHAILGRELDPRARAILGL